MGDRWRERVDATADAMFAEALDDDARRSAVGFAQWAREHPEAGLAQFMVLSHELAEGKHQRVPVTEQGDSDG